eukprot:1147666-Pelagomonas_calceolata.AAC.12
MRSSRRNIPRNHDAGRRGLQLYGREAKGDAKIMDMGCARSMDKGNTLKKDTGDSRSTDKGDTRRKDAGDSRCMGKCDSRAWPNAAQGAWARATLEKWPRAALKKWPRGTLEAWPRVTQRKNLLPDMAFLMFCWGPSFFQLFKFQQVLLETVKVAHSYLVLNSQLGDTLSELACD